MQPPRPAERPAAIVSSWIRSTLLVDDALRTRLAFAPEMLRLAEPGPFKAMLTNTGISAAPASVMVPSCPVRSTVSRVPNSPPLLTHAVPTREAVLSATTA